MEEKTMMGFGFLGMLLFWGLFLALIVGGAAFLLQRKGDSGPARDTTALRILDERLARGEIGREEYETIRAALQR
jgi:putative membrane protein